MVSEPSENGRRTERTPARPAPRRDAVPERWEAELRRRLDPGETVLAWFAPDLDPHLQFVEGLVVLTERRILDFGSDARPAGRAWALSEAEALKSYDRAGIGTLSLLGSETRLASWRYTVARTVLARALVDRFGLLKRGETPVSENPAEVESCPICGTEGFGDPENCPTCTLAAAEPKTRSLLRLARFFRPRAGAVFLGFFLTLASTAAGLIPPYLTKPLTDDVLIKQQNGENVPFDLVLWYLVALGGSAVLAWLLSWARTYVMAWVGERISADMRNDTYEHLQKLSIDYYTGKRTGDLMSRLSSDTDRICSFLSVNVVDFSADILMIVGTTFVLVAMNPALSVATLLPFPIIALLVYYVRDGLRRGFNRSYRVWGEMTSVLADTIPGVRVVKAFAQESREVARFREANDRILEANDRVNTTWSFTGPTIAFLTQIGLLVVWCYGAWLVFRSEITVGTLLAFLAFIGRFYTRLESMTRIVQAVQRAAASTDRLFSILDRVPTVPDPVKPVHPGRLAGALELRNVGFRYGHRQVLAGIDLTVRPGEMIGLVGASGAGKSTLVNLVCRFYDVGDGAILADGFDIRNFPVSEYRHNIGMVLQEPFLFYGSIAENVAYGRPGATPGEIIAAARAARAHEFILRLIDGYDSLVGERGQSLSGGERQRISIARALLIDPRILILDEATSSVDTETERQIQLALDTLVQGRTTIAIAHRLSTLRKADRLVVLEQGRIVEVGPHQELLERGGAYARLHQAQIGLDGELGEGANGVPVALLAAPPPAYEPPPRQVSLAECRLDHDAFGRLVLIHPDGTRHVGVDPVRAFPLSDPTRWVGVCGPDGRELAFIEDLDQLPAEVRSTIESELAQRELLPIIQKIVRISSTSTPCDWDIRTDRGPTRLSLESEDNLRRLGLHRVMVTDAHGLRYVIPDMRALDGLSKRLLDRVW